MDFKLVAGREREQLVVVANADPVADAGADAVVGEGRTLAFDGTAIDPGVDDVLGRHYAENAKHHAAAVDEALKG